MMEVYIFNIMDDVLNYLHNHYLMSGVKGEYQLNRICGNLSLTQVKFIGTNLNKTGFAEYKFQNQTHLICITDKGIKMFEEHLDYKSFLKSEFLRLESEDLHKNQPQNKPIIKLPNAIIKSVANLARFVWTNKLLSSIIIFPLGAIVTALISHYLEYNFFQKWYKDSDSQKIETKKEIIPHKKKDTIQIKKNNQM